MGSVVEVGTEEGSNGIDHDKLDGRSTEKQWSSLPEEFKKFVD